MMLSNMARWLTQGTNLLGTAYLNCEVRIFDFTEKSTKDDAHFTESEKSKTARVRPTENDASVLSELDAVADK